MIELTRYELKATAFHIAAEHNSSQSENKEFNNEKYDSNQIDERFGLRMLW